MLTDIKSPGRIVRRQNGHTVMDVEVKTWKPIIRIWYFPSRRM